MSTYYGYVNSAYSVSASDYDSPSAWYSDCNSADFYAENNVAYPQISESSPREPVPPTKDDIHCVLVSWFCMTMPT
ncbi:hypothetical protein VIGAN_10105000 [Vigna angularis var. angularis]|uniref:Uncharacterized protein n=1 Tax=Vigna angularis var. angularis TaxID=157739 RepID=A0A0S3T3B6_PHAAN|nr:hypothetical protein VIGAN_10105000 [Vigna angularis var. angularis]